MKDRFKKLAKLLAEAKSAGYSQAKVAEWLECTPRALQKKWQTKARSSWSS